VPATDEDTLSDANLLNERQAAHVIGAQPGTLAVWRTKGKGPAYIRIGPRMIRYRRADLMAFADAHRVDPRAS
jgi:predicted DNA-binding transcriptional regulator AlpA